MCIRCSSASCVARSGRSAAPDLPRESPAVFYPRRAWDFVSVAGKWAALALRYRAILRRVVADKDGASYVDEALKPATEVDHAHDFVAGYADKIPDTYGAPKREPRRRNEGKPPFGFSWPLPVFLRKP